MNRPDYILITRPDDWSDCLEQLHQEPRLAVDLEANSMFAYRERVCLIQVSTPARDYIIDPLAQLDLSELGRIFADPAVEKIFHAAEYDLILMGRQYDWVVNGLSDTMWAARILGYERYGLANLLEQCFDVHLDKRYQKSNWCQRPLTPEQLAYACLDTHFLFQLRDRLASELREAGREEEAVEIFRDQTRVKINDNGFDPESFWTINGVQDLSRQQQAILRALHIFRDQEAQRRDQPLFKIFSDRTMLEIARTSPATLNELSAIHGMSRGQLRRYGQGLLEVVADATQARPPVPPRRRKRNSEVELNRYERLHTWRKLRARARGVESDVIVSRDALWELARENPQSDADLQQLACLGEWRCKTYGEEILKVLNDS
jgi:ribonuclease D